MRDLLLEDGDLPAHNRFTTGLPDIRQRIESRLRRMRGEWFLDITSGIPYETWREQKPPRLGEIVADIRTAIEAIEGVVATSDFRADHDTANREITVTGTYTTAEGIVDQITAAGVAVNGSPWAVYFQVFRQTHAPLGALPRI